VGDASTFWQSIKLKPDEQERHVNKSLPGFCIGTDRKRLKRQLSLDKAAVIALIMKNIYQMGELC
jgi:hypothetical protein